MISLANKSGRFEIPHFTIHDLRRTALTGMARLGVAPLDLWADRLIAIVGGTGAHVVPMQARHA